MLLPTPEDIEEARQDREEEERLATPAKRSRQATNAGASGEKKRESVGSRAKTEAFALAEGNSNASMANLGANDDQREDAGDEKKKRARDGEEEHEGASNAEFVQQQQQQQQEEKPEDEGAGKKKQKTDDNQ